LVPVVVKAGGCSFHHPFTFHGSGPNTATVERRAVVSHLLPVETRFHPVNVDLNYSRYRRHGDLSMDESFFPVTWDASGGRTPWLAELPTLD
jgi:ectoine hydroxylase-related dioxygenase (phytanoyl-CoA dioxygenase family)